MRRALSLLLLLASPAAAQDLTARASRQASSPETAWSANLPAPDMQNEIARRLSAFTAPEPRTSCPPGQAPEQTPPPAVGAILSATLAQVACAPVAVPRKPELNLPDAPAADAGVRLDGAGAPPLSGARLEADAPAAAAGARLGPEETGAAGRPLPR